MVSEKKGAPHKGKRVIKGFYLYEGCCRRTALFGGLKEEKDFLPPRRYGGSSPIKSLHGGGVYPLQEIFQ